MYVDHYGCSVRAYAEMVPISPAVSITKDHPRFPMVSIKLRINFAAFLGSYGYNGLCHIILSYTLGPANFDTSATSSHPS